MYRAKTGKNPSMVNGHCPLDSRHFLGKWMLAPSVPTTFADLDIGA
jgi:hypothetical protein